MSGYALCSVEAPAHHPAELATVEAESMSTRAEYEGNLNSQPAFKTEEGAAIQASSDSHQAIPESPQAICESPKAMPDSLQAIPDHCQAIPDSTNAIPDSSKAIPDSFKVMLFCRYNMLFNVRVQHTTCVNFTQAAETGMAST